MNQNLHETIVLMGSNISPVENLRGAYLRLAAIFEIQAVSTAWENAAVGSQGPNFFNAALAFKTALPAFNLREDVLRPIETSLGRVRTSDKNSARTIDLDIILYGGQVLDPNLWNRVYIALPISELKPDLVNPVNGKDILTIAQSLKEAQWVIPHPDVFASVEKKSPVNK